VLAGIVASQAGVSWPEVIRLSIGVSLFYTAGMFLNDVADRDSDAMHRRDRPIPAGDVTPRAATPVALVVLVAGELVIAAQPRVLTPVLRSLGLVAAIVYYDYRHKWDSLGPFFIGICRGLVYFVAAAADSRSHGVPYPTAFPSVERQYVSADPIDREL
jgi:4-hydroxybenzoate polyprenyltransferase